MTNIPTIPHHFTVGLTSEGQLCFFYCASSPVVGLRLTTEVAERLGTALHDYARMAYGLKTGEIRMKSPEWHTTIPSGKVCISSLPLPRRSVLNFDQRDLVAQTLRMRHSIGTRDVTWEVRDEKDQIRTMVGEVVDHDNIILNLATTGHPEVMHGTWKVTVTEKQTPDAQ